MAAWDPFNTRTQYAYDPMNRVRTQTVDSGAVANPLGAANSCVASEFICSTAPSPWPAGTTATFATSTFYGQVGLDSVLAPRNVPRGFRYNAAGVQTQELDHNSATSTRTFVNGAGLVDSTVSRDSQVVRFRYDVVGRLVAKIWPARTWGALYDDGKLARPAATVPGDSVVYRYDQDGRLLMARSTAVGGDSVVRTYWANGAVRTVVSTKFLLDSLLFWYDAAGALQRKVHVTAANGQVARDTTIYVIDSTTGTLTAMIFAVAQPTAKAGRRQVSFTWDSLGRRRSVTYPSGHPVTFRYDAGGVMRQMTSGEPGANGLPSCGYPNDNLCVSVANDSVDLRGNVLHTSMTCLGIAHPGYACGTQFTRSITNAYYRTGWLARQLDGYRSDSAITYDQSGSILRRWDHDLKKWHSFTYQARTNRMVRDSTGPAYIYWDVGCSWWNPFATGCTDSSLVDRYSWTTYNAAGSRITDSTTRVRRSPNDPERPGPGYSDRYYYYDALGRTTGIVHFDQYHWTSDGNGNAWFTPIGAGNDCVYDVEGRMVRTCGAATDVTYDGANVSATNNGIWHFLHGPGTDDPLLGVGQALNGATKEFYWVTDGQGRQYAMAEATGWWDPDFNAETWPGFQQAGGITDATGYKAGRDQGSSVPGVSYFRNRIYDQQSGQWTQEDPLGLAGGLNLYQYAGGNPAMFTDPWGLCPPQDQNNGPECQQGVILTLSVSVAGAIPGLGLGGNAEAGVAINLATGATTPYAHAGPSVGTGGGASAEAALVFGQSNDQAIGSTGNPINNAIETELNAGLVSPQLVTESGSHPFTPVGGGLGVGPGVGVLSNGTAVETRGPTLPFGVYVRMACTTVGLRC